jgi:hypothetical protein
MTRPPGGSPPPAEVKLADREVVLAPLLEQVADRYFEEFPDDLERYGDAARQWELHDTAHCINWAALDVMGYTSLHRNISWLAKVLRARAFPVEQLARNLELAADVCQDALDERVAERLRDAATLVRSTS